MAAPFHAENLTKSINFIILLFPAGGPQMFLLERRGYVCAFRVMLSWLYGTATCSNLPHAKKIQFSLQKGGKWFTGRYGVLQWHYLLFSFARFSILAFAGGLKSSHVSSLALVYVHTYM